MQVMCFGYFIVDLFSSEENLCNCTAAADPRAPTNIGLCLQGPQTGPRWIKALQMCYNITVPVQNL